MLYLDVSLEGYATESFIWNAGSIICTNHHHHHLAFPSHSLLRLKYAFSFPRAGASIFGARGEICSGWVRLGAALVDSFVAGCAPAVHVVEVAELL